jgi:hypothetical protein
VPLVSHGTIFKSVGTAVAPSRLETIKTLLPYSRTHPATGVLCVSLKDVRALSKANQKKLVEYGILTRHYIRLNASK